MMFQLRHYDMQVTGNIFGAIFMDIDQYNSTTTRTGM